MLNKESKIRLLEMLKTIPELNGRIYFKLPSNHELKYPCAKCDFSNIIDDKADNIRYFKEEEYSITIIDRNLESLIPNKVLNLPYCRLDRPYTADGLYHWVFTIYI